MCRQVSDNIIEPIAASSAHQQVTSLCFSSVLTSCYLGDFDGPGCLSQSGHVSSGGEQAGCREQNACLRETSIVERRCSLKVAVNLEVQNAWVTQMMVSPKPWSGTDLGHRVTYRTRSPGGPRSLADPGLLQTWVNHKTKTPAGLGHRSRSLTDPGLLQTQVTYRPGSLTDLSLLQTWVTYRHNHEDTVTE